MSTMQLFNEAFYLARYPDVRAAVEAGHTSARDHYFQWGRVEGRQATPLFNPAEYLAAYPDVAAAVEQGLTTAYDHFVTFGAQEGRKPFAAFEVSYYLARNPDVADAVAAGHTSAVEHFLLHGCGEGRPFLPAHDTAEYLAARPALAQAVAAGEVSIGEYMIQDLVLGMHEIVLSPTVILISTGSDNAGGAPTGDAADSQGHDVSPGEVGGVPAPGAGPIPSGDQLAPHEMLGLLNQVNWAAIANDGILQSAYFTQNLPLFIGRLGDLMPPSLAPAFEGFDVTSYGLNWALFEDAIMSLISTDLLTSMLGMASYPYPFESELEQLLGEEIPRIEMLGDGILELSGISGSGSSNASASIYQFGHESEMAIQLQLMGAVSHSADLIG